MKAKCSCGATLEVEGDYLDSLRVIERWYKDHTHSPYSPNQEGFVVNAGDAPTLDALFEEDW